MKKLHLNILIIIAKPMAKNCAATFMFCIVFDGKADGKGWLFPINVIN